MKAEFEKTNILFMLFLVIVTLGLYVPIYFYDLKQVADRLKISGKVDSTVIDMLMFFSIADILLFILSFSDPVFYTMGHLLDFVILILVLILSFEFKSVLEEYFSKVLKKKDVYFSSLWTFLFTILYLQLKINNN